jgi:hypothetical protein
MRTTMLVVVVLVAGCARLFPPPQQTNGSTEDFIANSWRGRPLLEMESHPVFSMLKAEKQELSDGSTIYHHMRCLDWQDTQRSGIGFGPGYEGGINAQQGTQTSQKGQVCCDRQFVVRAGVIQQYRQVPMGGDCQAEFKYSAAGSAPRAGGVP